MYIFKSLLLHLLTSWSHLSPLGYSLLLAVSAAAVRDTSSIMVGQYFKLRRDLAEMWSIAGTGIGVLSFSLLYFQAVG